MSRAYDNAADARFQQGGRRNLIINGAMQVWQRGTSSTAVGSSNTYHADRFLAREDTDGGLTTERSTESPDNFKYSTKVTVTSADTSLGAAQKAYFSQRLEGTVWDHLNFGTSAAQTVTLSFYVRSSLTGTFSGSLINDNNNRAYPWEYTINTANTWERKTITIAGDTTGTWDTGSGDWMELYWDLGLGSNFEGTAGAWAAAQDFGTSGSVKLIGTNSATWYITGVQLEVGNVATPFEHRSYGEELALCQRYYYTHINANGQTVTFACNYYSNTNAEMHVPFHVTMRSAPSIDMVTGSGYYKIYRLGGSDSVSGFTSGGSHTNLGYMFNNTEVSSTQGTGGHVQASNASAYLAFDAEL